MAAQAKAIFFDLGETLVTQNIEDSMVTKNALQDISRILPKPASARTLFRLYMKSYGTNDALRSEYNVEIPISVWIPGLLNRVIGKEPARDLVDNCIRIIVTARAANAVAFADAHDTLRSLSRRRVKLGVISNVSSHEVAVRILEKVGLVRYFDLIVTSALTGIRKPDPGIFRYALYQLKMEPEEAVIVGDSEKHDIQGGYASGLKTVLIDRRQRVENSLANHHFGNLREALPTLELL